MHKLEYYKDTLKIWIPNTHKHTKHSTSTKHTLTHTDMEKTNCCEMPDIITISIK